MNYAESHANLSYGGGMRTFPVPVARKQGRSKTMFPLNCVRRT